MKKTILTILSFAFIAFGIHAQTNLGSDDFLNPLYTGIPSLSIAPDARAGGMGDVGAATVPDVFSQHWNPSKYAFMESPAGLAFSYTPWLSRLVEDINLFYICGYWKLDDLQSFSASMRYFSLGKVTLRQHENDLSDLSAKPNEFAFDLAYSRKLSENFSASVAFRYIRGDLNVPAMQGETEMIPANAFAADVSAYYTTPIAMATGDAILSFGANISNIGNKITYDDEYYNFLPTNLRLGGSFDIPFDSYNRLSVNADINKLLVVARGSYRNNPSEYNDMTMLSSIFNSFSDAPGGFKEELQEVMWSAGLEYSYNKQFFVRAGYFNEHANKGGRKYFTAGAGFKLNVFQLDAGYVIATTPANPLDQTLRFSLSFDMFGLKDLMN